ncbi:hypothetical protein [Aestuariimicrobium sp. Y1814]|uniref:hypothetical protein n=1 Tax=Aestuariimicrobium sp. Y1814 TaxID=3418742 RepID=UPI003DA78679
MVTSDPLAAFLYTYGSHPVPPELDPAWPMLLLRRAELSVRHDLADHTRSSSPGWLSWTHTGADITTLLHKVYASPTVAALPRALPIIFATAIAEAVPAWKVGATLRGIHRPDKVVLYLPTADDADATAEALDRALTGIPAHGVAFTGQVGSGIASRGLDHGTISWRALVCHALAQHLREARATLGGDSPPELVATTALTALASSGYDTRSWRPGPTPVAVRP